MPLNVKTNGDPDRVIESPPRSRGFATKIEFTLAAISAFTERPEPVVERTKAGAPRGNRNNPRDRAGTCAEETR